MLLAVVFLATVLRSTIGFGDALLAVPLLALVMPVAVATPVVVLISTTIALVVVAQDWRHVHLRSALWLLLPTFAGIPLGVALLAGSHARAVKATLGVVIAAFAAYSLLGRRTLELRRDSRRWMLGCGLLAGVLGGAFGMNGPPLVVYGAMRRWPPQPFRATLQGYFLPAGIVSMATYRLAGLWVPAVTRDYLLALLAVPPAIILGRALNRRLRAETFLKYVHGGLIMIGALLVFQALGGL